MQHATLLRLATLANTAPSVHNTQPTRWALGPDGRLWLGADLSRHLPHSDPQMDDMGVSGGAALATTLLALERLGWHGEMPSIVWAKDDRTSWPGHRMIATLRVHPTPPTTPDHRAPHLEARATWRRGFRAPTPEEERSLHSWASRQKGAVWVTGQQAQTLLGMGDAAAADLLRTPGVRQELVAWMRPNGRDGDGLTRESLGMGRVTYALAKAVLGGAMFDRLDAKGVVARVASEAQASRHMAGWLLVHTPAIGGPVQGGIHLARLWLEATARGLAGWPMAALVDHPESAAALRATYRIGPERRLVMALRLGYPTGALPRTRLNADTLVGKVGT